MTGTKNFRLILPHFQVLDISGNGMGDVGARLLAKALQINTRFGTMIGNDTLFTFTLYNIVIFTIYDIMA